MRTIVPLLLVLCLALNLLGVHAACNNGALEGGYCNCYAGSAPDYSIGAANCGNAYTGTCTNAADTDTVSGSNAPTLDDIRLANDRLILTFKQPVVTNPWHRTVTNIKFYKGSSTLGAVGSSACFYPGSVWTKVVNTCEDEYIFSMPWGHYASCGFDKAVTYSTLTYTAVVEFTYKEVDDKVAPTVTRTLSNLFNLNIQIARQKDITASLELKILDTTSTTTPAVSAYIVGGSSYDLFSGKNRIIVQTQTAWPYKVASPLSVPVRPGPQSVSSPTDTAVAITPDYLSADNCQPNTYCIQQFEIVISSAPAAANPLCDFFGDYVFSTELVCSDVTTCTPMAGPNITISVDHTDVCTPLEIDTTHQHEESLLPFSDKTLETAASMFETGAVSYWAFAVVDPNVSIDSVKLYSITVRDTTASTTDTITPITGATLHAALVEPKGATNGVYPPGTKAVVSFGLKLARNTLPQTLGNLEPGDIRPLELEVVVEIVHHGNKKRVTGVIPANGGTAAGVAKFVVKSTGNKSALSANSAASYLESILGSNCTGFTCTIVSLVQKAKSVLGF